MSAARKSGRSRLAQLGLRWRPEAYHGRNRRGDFFEGWFIKLVDAAKQQVFSLIPGIFLSRDPAKTHSFIQLLDGRMHRAHYLRFATGEFHSSRQIFSTAIAGNRFDSDGITLDLQTSELCLTGDIRFSGLHPWPVTLTSPGIMGWYAFTPFMQCYHGVVSMDHQLEGLLEIDGAKIDFTGGRGYIEKDWGRSFPSSYVWLQCNHFSRAGICLSGSVAQIPWLSGAFRGFIVGLLLDGRLYRFTTYTGARIEVLELTAEKVFWSIADRHYRLEVEALRTDGGVLHAPYGAAMVQRVSESLSSQLKLRFSDKKGETIFEDTGNPAALEIHGRLEEIVDRID